MERREFRDLGAAGYFACAPTFPLATRPFFCFRGAVGNDLCRQLIASVLISLPAVDMPFIIFTGS